MRQLIFVIALALACGTSTSAPNGSGSGGGGGPPVGGGGSGGTDAGVTPPLDAGGSPPADAGSSADAGTTTGNDDGGMAAGGGDDGGTSSGGSDGGTTINADCQGIVPDSLGSSFSFEVPPPPGGTTQCDAASSDEQGNLIANNDGSNTIGISWELFSPSGAHLAHVSMWTPYPQPSGWEGIQLSDTDTGSSHLTWFLPDGTAAASTFVANDQVGALAFRNWPTGTVVASTECHQPPGSLQIRKFDGRGQQLSMGQLAAGCSLISAVGDANGNTLVLTAPGTTGNLKGTWLDGAGNVIAPEFPIQTGSSGPFNLRALVGGGAVIQEAMTWKYFVHSGTAQIDPPPAWLANGHDFAIVRGEKAYALLSRTSGDSHVIELFSTRGTRCGALTFPLGALTAGADGSVIASSGNAGCTKTVWPGLLR